MSIELDTQTDWGWSLATTFSTLAEPIARATEFAFRCQTPVVPGQFDNYDTVFKEKAYRASVGAAIVGGAALTLSVVPAGALALGALGYGALLATTRLGAYYLQNGKGYTYVKGNGLLKALGDSFSVMSWNVCGIWGGISRSNGGVLEWRKRFAEILAQITSADPDVLVLEEIYDTALAEKLIESLKGRYAHFYTTMGPNHLGGVGGLFVATRLPVAGFSHVSFDNNTWQLNRGFAMLDIGDKGKPVATVIGTHLIHGNAVEARAAQVAQIVNTVAQRTLQAPTFLTGDINQDHDEFVKSTLPRIVEMPPRMVTCTDKFIREGWDSSNRLPDEELDRFVQLNNGAPKANVQVRQLGLLDRRTTRTAVSDHDALMAVVKGVGSAAHQANEGKADS